jgi:hypothetical protein
MSKSKASKSKKDSKSLMESLPSNVPFAPVVRRPDYQLRFVKFSLPTEIPIELIMAVVLIGLFFIYIGGFYDLAQDNILAFGSDSQGNPVVISGELGSQFLVEGLAAGILMFVGAGGFFLINYSTKYAYSPRNSTILLIIGVGVVVIAWVSIMFIFRTKIG